MQFATSLCGVVYAIIYSASGHLGVYMPTAVTEFWHDVLDFIVDPAIIITALGLEVAKGAFFTTEAAEPVP